MISALASCGTTFSKASASSSCEDGWITDANNTSRLWESTETELKSLQKLLPAKSNILCAYKLSEEKYFVLLKDRDGSYFEFRKSAENLEIVDEGYIFGF